MATPLEEHCQLVRFTVMSHSKGDMESQGLIIVYKQVHAQPQMLLKLVSPLQTIRDWES